MTLEDQRENQRYKQAITSDGTPELLSDLLRLQATLRPLEPACVVLDRHGRASSRTTYGELDRRARAVAAGMQRSAGSGERALLAFTTGVDFLVGLFACAYAGIVAVPVPSPGKGAAGGGPAGGHHQGRHAQPGADHPGDR